MRPRWQVPDQIRALEANDWMDVQTRVLFVDFALYSPLTRLFAVIRFFVEFPASGSPRALASAPLLAGEYVVAAC